MATTVARPDTKQLEKEQIELRRQYDGIVVKDADTCLLAKKTMQAIRLAIKMRHAILDPFVALAKKGYDDAKDERAKYIDPLQTMDDGLGMQVKEFERKEREAAQREQDRINEERRRVAAIEAERMRKEQEAQAAADRKAREKEIAEALKAKELGKREADRLRKEADEAKRKQIEEAVNQAALASIIDDVIVKPNLSSVAGVPSRVNWRFRITNPDLIPERYWVLDHQALGADVRRDKDKTNIPGIEIFCE